TADTRQQRHVALPAAAAEAARQLRDAARARGVEVRLGNLPTIEVNAAAVELALANLLSNAIKYSDPAKERGWVEVTAHVGPTDERGVYMLEVQVRDNGISVPES